MESILVYTGLCLLLVAFVLLLRPLRFLGMSSRRRAGVIAGVGLVLVLVGVTLPAPLMYPAGRRLRIDDFMPRYQFNEVHSTSVHAPADRIFRAIKAITPEEIRFFRTLTWMRSPRLGSTARSKESILAAPPKTPLLDVALRSGFLLLAEAPNQEMVVGSIVCCGRPPRVASPQEFQEFARPDSAKAALSFHLEDQGGGWIRVTTETRVFATDPSARRKFAVYWRVIYPGSAIIRRMWLAAIKCRAEAGS